MVASQSHGTAKRLRHSGLIPEQTYSVNMASVTCEKCGDQYAIAHRTEHQDHALATLQAEWLADRFVWDHIQESKHSGSIQLPLLPEKSH